MYTRHDEIPIYEIRALEIEAQHYNIVFRALFRRPQGIRLALPGLRTLDLILQNNAWIIVDRSLGDIPVAAWCEFRVPQDRALHEPIGCQMRYFHQHAGVILESVLTLMDVLLDEQLSNGDKTHKVLTFPKKDRGDQV